MSGHTATPWEVETPMGDETLWIVEAGKHVHEWRCIAMVCSDDPINDKDRDPLEPLTPEDAAANAAFIVTACNSHAELVKALERIEKWFGEFPETGMFWDEGKTVPMSYASAFGSNGERDFMREIARAALAKAKGAARDAASRSDARSGDVLTIPCEKCDSETSNTEDESGEILCTNCLQNAAEAAYERFCEDFHDGGSTAPWPETTRKQMQEARKLK